MRAIADHVILGTTVVAALVGVHTRFALAKALVVWRSSFATFGVIKAFAFTTVSDVP